MREGIGILNQLKAKSVKRKWTRVSKLFHFKFHFNSDASELELFALYMIISKDIFKGVQVKTFFDNRTNKLCST